MNIMNFKYLFNNLLNKENYVNLNNFQISINLNKYLLPTILNKEKTIELLKSLLEDLSPPSDSKEFEERSDYNRQWRFYGADCKGLNGVDQIQQLCSIIKKRKSDRRLLLVALDPRDSSTLSLTQALIQFYVSDDRLSCKVYQNIAKFNNIIRYDSCRVALLTYMLCHVTGLSPGTLVHSFGSIIVDSEDIIIEDIWTLSVKINEKCDDIDLLSSDYFNLIHNENYKESDASAIIKERNCHAEDQYLTLISSIIKDGVTLEDRTLVGTRSIFGPQMIFSLQNGILPLLTTKRVFYRGIIEELLWFVRGSTNANELAAKNVHIWDANGSKEFLTNVGLGHREAGDLGPVYGFQWRHFGAKYKDMYSDYSGKGIDQIDRVIKSIKTDPGSPNHIIIAWNPNDLHLMALPPCHCLIQFFVNNDELSCKLYQRSGDIGLGVPFNIASYAFLTHMIAHITNLRPGYFIHSLGDAHVYLNHIDPLKIQIEREPKPFPTLRFARNIEKIEDFVIEDFVVEDYKPHPKIVMDMAV